MDTVARALGILLCGPNTRWTNLQDLADFWNKKSHADTNSASMNSGSLGNRVSVVEGRNVARSMLHDDGTMQHKATISQPNSPFHIEITLEPSHNLATVRHRRDRGEWAASGSPAHTAHLNRFFSGEPLCGRERALGALWPALLGSARLDVLPQIRGPSQEQVVSAIMCAPWSMSDRDR